MSSRYDKAIGITFLAAIMLLPVRTMADSHWILERLDYFLWENRIILVKTDSQEAADGFRMELGSQSAEVDDRHLVWFIFTPDQLLTNYKGPLGPDLRDEAVSKYFSDFRGDTEVVLIGKDGGIAHRSKKLELQYLFDLIDSMPMRQQEMRSGS
jgi:hypothetical protein